MKDQGQEKSKNVLKGHKRKRKNRKEDITYSRKDQRVREKYHKRITKSFQSQKLHRSANTLQMIMKISRNKFLKKESVAGRREVSARKKEGYSKQLQQRKGPKAGQKVSRSLDFVSNWSHLSIHYQQTFHLFSQSFTFLSVKGRLLFNSNFLIVIKYEI